QGGGERCAGRRRAGAAVRPERYGRHRRFHPAGRGSVTPAPLVPPRLKNDCFALPPGIDWTPVDIALGLLRANLSPVVAVEELDVSDALGRILARDAIARRSNPPAPNAAVDGY